MAVFISYSSHDSNRVEQLAATLRRAREEIWYDSELGGGDAWWRMIMERIRACDVFLVALSQNLVQSKACQGELQYAQALGKPILPVQVGPVDSMCTNPLAATQVIDFQNPTIDTGIELIAALNWARNQPAPLPDPLPDEPPMPFRADSQITQETQQVGTGGYGCQHVLRRHANVILDVLTCRTPPGDESNALADQIAKKADA